MTRHAPQGFRNRFLLSVEDCDGLGSNADVELVLENAAALKLSR